MQDSQVPTDPEDEASDPPRRASLRLRDAEAVASVRRDMFGDGSLLDSMAAPQPPDPQPSPVQAAADQPHSADNAGGEKGDPSATPFASVPQSLDAIIDSFPAEPADVPPSPAGDNVEASPAAASPVPFSPVPFSEAPGTEGSASEPSPHAEAPTAAAPQMGISSLFDSLGNLEPRADDAPSTEQPPAPTEPTAELDMSMLEMGSPAGSAPEPEGDRPVGASPDIALLLPVLRPEFHPHEVPAEDAGSVDEPPAPGAPTLDLDMSMLERPPARPVLQADGDPSYVDPSPFPEHGLNADGVRAGGVEPEASFQQRGDASDRPGAHARNVDEPSFGEIGGASAFSGRMGPPPFTERPGAADAETYPEHAELPVHADPDAEGPPPFIAPLVTSAFPGPADEPTQAPRYGEPMTTQSFRGLVEPANDRGAPEPRVMPAYPEPVYTEPTYAEPAEAAARPMFDADSKIEAEAQATAQALDNLKRLLAHTTPSVQEPLERSAYGSAPGQARLNLQGDPTPFQSDGPAALIPMPMPVPPEPGRFRGIYVLGFLTGIGLSVMAGVALYVLINMI